MELWRMTREVMHPSTNPVFNRIFGQEKAITIEIINLLIKPPNPVVDLEYLPSEMFHDMKDVKKLKKTKKIIGLTQELFFLIQ